MTTKGSYSIEEVTMEQVTLSFELTLLMEGRHFIGLLMPADSKAVGFYPVSTDGLKRAENFRSCLATLRRIRGL